MKLGGALMGGKLKSRMLQPKYSRRPEEKLLKNNAFEGKPHDINNANAVNTHIIV